MTLTKERLDKLEHWVRSGVGLSEGHELQLIAAARELETVKCDAGRMHYLGNLARPKDQAEWDELRALMRKYPPLPSAPEQTKETT